MKERLGTVHPTATHGARVRKNIFVPTLLVSNSDATEYFYGYVSMKIGVWSFISGIMLRWAKAPAPQEQNHTDFEPQKPSNLFNFISSNPVPSHSNIFSLLWGGVKCEVWRQGKQPLFFSSHDGMASNSRNASGHEKRSPASSKIIQWPWNVKSTQHTQTHPHAAGDPWGNWLLSTTLQLHFLALICI